MVLSDEIYSRLQFEGEPFSIMQFPGMQERTILLDGFSKTYAMTGWRIGYGVMRPDLAAQMTRLMTNSNSCTASFTQMAGIEALRGDQSAVGRMCAEFKHRSEIFVGGLNRIKGFSCRMPKGAFYVFPNITATGWQSKRWPMLCWSRRASPRFQARPSASSAKAMCASAWPIRSPILLRPCTASTNGPGRISNRFRSRTRQGAPVTTRKNQGARPQHIHTTRAGIDDRARRQAWPSRIPAPAQ